MNEDEVTARHAIQASAEKAGGNVVTLALFDRVGGYDALVLCSFDSPGHVAKYVTWRSHWLKNEKALPGVYWGNYHLNRHDADHDYNERHTHLGSLSSCFIPIGGAEVKIFWLTVFVTLAMW